VAKIGNLASRFLVAVVAAPILLLGIYQDNPVFVWLMVFGGALVAMSEFFAMTIADRTDRLASLAFGALAAAAFYWSGPNAAVGLTHGGELVAMFVATVPVALYYLFRFGDMQTVGARLAASVTGIVYVGILFSFVALLKRDVGGNDGGHMILFVLLLAWVGDTGAYFAGRFPGKRKLYEAVSPKKTWAGALGGLAGSVAGAVFVKAVLLADAPWLSWFDVFALAIPAAALGQMGDLVESMVKRSSGVKDSGSILPGHGGILDRVDAVLFIAPYVYLYLVVIRPQFT
jgi:phosphatidate cytidylyltransferase